MSEQEGRPKRAHARHDVDIRVDWSTGQMFLSGEVSNLSEGGLFLRTEGPMPSSGDVSLVLMLPGGSPVRAKGRVVWNRTGGAAPPPEVRPSGCGLQFVDIDLVDRAMLLDYLREVIARVPPARGQ